ncbi:Ankyrin repeat protein [Legionella steigerwaltii]|uniref:Ankyrin repeat protein n=1 Tax=Legionella steigerwaltii TaxID=460 RepID=A0A378LA93_9GAMM|nr:ankyrin repeat domain-containing protein [Legionella steigerwaltii]KTD75756.1 Ankyrin repeat protein [Legionella steigerwaltii]STY23733.1 Ankyrin repeat protein [Legionella steigerwaltii]
MFSKLVEQRLQSVLNDSNREDFNAVIVDSSKLETPEEELQFLLSYLNGIIGDDKNNAVVKLMGELLSSYLIFTNPSGKYCKKLNTLLEGYQSSVGNSPIYSEQLKQMRENLSQQIRLKDTSEFKSSLLEHKISLSTCILITRTLLEKNKSLETGYINLMVEKLKKVSPQLLKENAAVRQNYLILIKELKKANSKSHLRTLEKLARPVVLMQIGEEAREQVESNNINISTIENEIRKIKIPDDIGINLKILKKYGKDVQALEERLKEIEKLLAEEQQKEQVHLQYFDDAEKIYSGEDLKNFKKIGEVLVGKSLEAVKLSQSRYQEINRVIVEFSKQVAALSSHAEEENKGVNKQYEEIEKKYREFYSDQESALAQLEIIKAQNDERLTFLKANNLLDNSQDLDDALKIFDEIHKNNADFKKVAVKFEEELRSFDPSQDLQEKRQKIATLSDELLKLSKRFQMQDTLGSLRKHLENLSQQVNLSIKSTRETQSGLAQQRDSAKSEKQEIEKRAKTLDEEIKRLQTEQSQNWETLKLSLKNQRSEIDSKTIAIQSFSKKNKERIDSLGAPIFWYGLPIIRWFFADRLNAYQQERDTLLATNNTLAKLDASLQKIKKTGEEIAASEKPVTDFGSLISAYSEMQNLVSNAQSNSLSQYAPKLYDLDQSPYVTVSMHIAELTKHIAELTKKKDALLLETETKKAAVEDFTRKIAEIQKKIGLLESHKERTLNDLLIEEHAKEHAGIDLTQMGNKQFLLHLQSSAQTGNLDQIKLIMEHCIHLDAPNSNGNNALHFAAHKGEVEAARLLLSQNEPWHSKNKDGNTPLHIAAMGEKPDMVRLLLANLKDKDSNFRNNRGNTPLHLAVSKGNLEIVEILLRDLRAKNLDWNLPNASGHTPLDSAVFQGKTVVVNLLIDDLKERKALPKAADQFNNLLFIAYKKYSEAEEPNKRGKRDNFEIIIQRLKEEGAQFDLSKQDRAGNNIFHLAAKNGDIQRIKELTNQEKSFLSQFMSNPINKENADGKTPLQLALENDHLNAVRLLILSGAKIDKQTFATEQGKLFLAEVSSTEDKEIYARFVKEGLITSPTQGVVGTSELAEQNSRAELAEDNDELYAQERLAEERLAEERLAREREVRVQSKINEIGLQDFNEKRARELIGEIKAASFKDKSRLANAKDKNGNTLLHFLVKNKKEKAVKEVCKYADVYIKDRNNKSALTLATESMHEKSGSLMGVVGSLAGKKIDDFKEAKIYQAVAEKAHRQDSAQLQSLKIISQMQLALQQLLPRHKTLILELKLKKANVGQLEQINKRAGERSAEIVVGMQRTKHKTEHKIIQPLESQQIVELQKDMIGIIQILKEDIASMEDQLKSLKNAEKYQWHSTEQDTPLHQAIKRGEIDSWNQRRNAEALAESINKMSSGYTPLHLAILYAKSGDSQEEQETSLRMAKFLIEKGADINAQNTKGETALHLLAQRSDPAALEIMKLLKARQVQTEAVDKDGNNARQIAKRENNPNFLTLFSTKCEEIIQRGVTFFTAPQQEPAKVLSTNKTEEGPVVDKTNLFKQMRKKKQEEQQQQERKPDPFKTN